jgi:hypothetical protein
MIALHSQKQTKPLNKLRLNFRLMDFTIWHTQLPFLYKVLTTLKKQLKWSINSVIYLTV